MRPTVEQLQRRYARQLSFLADRFRPGEALGLALTALITALGILAVALGSVTEDVIAGDELVGVDDPISRFLVGLRREWLTSVMWVITQLGSAFVLVPLISALGLLLWRKRGSWRPAAFLALTLAGASLSSTIIKLLIARPRPTQEALVHAVGFAFPSGHSTAAAAGWLSTALVTGLLLRSLRARALLVAMASVIAGLVGVSRIYLGVHTATDVLAGWALGTLWVALALTATHLLTARQSRPVTERPSP